MRRCWLGAVRDEGGLESAVRRSADSRRAPGRGATGRTGGMRHAAPMAGDPTRSLRCADTGCGGLAR